MVYIVALGRASVIHGTKIVFIALSMRKLLTCIVWPTQCEQTVVLTVVLVE